MEVEGVDACMLKEYLEKNYGYNEPIFINEIRLDGLNDNALRQYFKRMLKSGDLARFDTGIYYLPKASRLLKKSYLDPMKVIVRKYIKSTINIFLLILKHFLPLLQRRCFYWHYPYWQMEIFCAWQEKAPLNQTGSSRMQFIPLLCYYFFQNTEAKASRNSGSPLVRKFAGRYFMPLSCKISKRA